MRLSQCQVRLGCLSTQKQQATLLILKYCFLVIFRWLLVYICNLLSWLSYVECKQGCFNFKQEGVAVMSAAAKTDKLKQCQCKLNKPQVLIHQVCIIYPHLTLIPTLPLAEYLPLITVLNVKVCNLFEMVASTSLGL